ncbi:MAG TPA: hypothetical protein ENF42_00635, partial [Candidatus Bathyarchaeota archaeon]|nr:hypothetical protein [Candidatus Bathyarchaeota archaeon]
MSSDEDRVLAYRATILARMINPKMGKARIQGLIREIYGIEISKNTVTGWIYRGKKPNFKPTGLEKSLFYGEAYELALSLASRGYGHKKIATLVSRELPIRVSALTVYRWIKGLSKPSVNKLIIKEETMDDFAYLVGVLMGDMSRSKAMLDVKDRDFALEAKRCLEKVTGKHYRITERNELYIINTKNRWLREIYKSKLWKTVAWLRPKPFLQGLYDSDGSISPWILNKEHLTSAVIRLTSANKELILLVEKLLKTKGMRPIIVERPEMRRTINGREVKFGKCYNLILRKQEDTLRFARYAGFRMKRKRIMLSFLCHLIRSYDSAR